MHTLALVLGVLAVVIAAPAMLLALRLVGEVQRLRTALGTAQGELTALQAAPPPPSGPPPAQQLITVELLEPLALARTQSKAAGVMSSLRPQLVTKLVYDQAAKQIEDGLVQQGVAAEVRIHGAR